MNKDEFKLVNKEGTYEIVHIVTGEVIENFRLSATAYIYLNSMKDKKMFRVRKVK